MTSLSQIGLSEHRALRAKILATTHLPIISPATVLDAANTALPTAMKTEFMRRTPLLPTLSSRSDAVMLPTNPPRVKDEVTTPKMASDIDTHVDGPASGLSEGV